jgi:hypothetical protein
MFRQALLERMILPRSQHCLIRLKTLQVQAQERHTRKRSHYGQTPQNFLRTPLPPRQSPRYQLRMPMQPDLPQKIHDLKRLRFHQPR